jgi:AbrB family looped-hinge helix DNA binding protein
VNGKYRKVGAAGQVVVPAEIRRKLRVKAGTRVAFVIEAEGVYVQPITDEFIESMKGIILDSRLPSDVLREN